jgi:sulfate adenylyltransferase subunit 1
MELSKTRMTHLKKLEAESIHIMREVAAELQAGKEYEFKVGTKNTFGRITKINHRVDVNTLDEVSAVEIQLNEIANCTIKTASPVVIDEYFNIAGTSSFIVIDRLTNVTVGAGMLVDTSSETIEKKTFSSEKEKTLYYFMKELYPEWIK